MDKRTDDVLRAFIADCNKRRGMAPPEDEAKKIQKTTSEFFAGITASVESALLPLRAELHRNNIGVHTYPGPNAIKIADQTAENVVTVAFRQPLSKATERDVKILFLKVQDSNSVYGVGLHLYHDIGDGMVNVMAWSLPTPPTVEAIRTMMLDLLERAIM